MMILENDNFEQEVLQSDKPVLVDFFATWCGPCKMVAPLLEELSGEMGDAVKICKVDIDKCPDIAGKYGVMSIPTFILFKDGKDIAKNIGAMPKARIESFIKTNI